MRWSASRRHDGDWLRRMREALTEMVDEKDDRRKDEEGRKPKVERDFVRRVLCRCYLLWRQSL